MPFNLGPVELGLILLIVAMLFGVGKLPEVFGAVGKGVREFRKESGMVTDKQDAPAGQLPQHAQHPAGILEARGVGEAEDLMAVDHDREGPAMGGLAGSRADSHRIVFGKGRQD